MCCEANRQTRLTPCPTFGGKTRQRESITMNEKRTNELFLKVLAYIEDNLHRPISLDEVAKSACLSKYHLHRLMTDFLEEPLMSYITRVRLERSLMYLKTSSKTVEEVACDVGYKSVNSFIKAFKKRFGTPPKTHLSDFEFKNPAIKGNLSIPKITYVSTIHTLYTPVIGKYGGKKFDDAWSELLSYAKTNNLLSDNTRYLGVYFDDPKVTKESQCRAYVCLTVNKEIKTKTSYISPFKIDEEFYSVYTFQGEYDELSNVYDCIFGRENSNIHLHKTIFEEYIGHNEPLSPITRIFIPITKSAR